MATTTEKCRAEYDTGSFVLYCEGADGHTGSHYITRLEWS